MFMCCKIVSVYMKRRCIISNVSIADLVLTDKEGDEVREDTEETAATSDVADSSEVGGNSEVAGEKRKETDNSAEVFELVSFRREYEYSVNFVTGC